MYNYFLLYSPIIGNSGNSANLAGFYSIKNYRSNTYLLNLQHYGNKLLRVILFESFEHNTNKVMD